MNNYRQTWIRNTDLNEMLRSINGWHVNSICHADAVDAVKYVERHGWVGRRTHYSRMQPKGVEAFEITDAGLDQLAAWGGDEEGARKSRNFYRANVAKFKIGESSDR